MKHWIEISNTQKLGRIMKMGQVEIIIDNFKLKLGTFFWDQSVNMNHL